MLRLTPQLYQNCRDDAIKLCSAKPVWQDWSTDVDNGPLVLPCLFHHLSDENDDGDDENSRKDPEDFRDEKVTDFLFQFLFLSVLKLNYFILNSEINFLI